MKVADRGSLDSGEHHGPAIVGSFSLLAIKSSSNPSMVAFELWLTDKAHARVVSIYRSLYSTTLRARGLTSELIHYYLREIKAIHRCEQEKKKEPYPQSVLPKPS